MKFILIISIFVFFSSCIRMQNESTLRLNQEKNIIQFVSCSGRGTISSIGNFSGQLSFDFLAQNDSSFFQFSDFLGRKVLLLALTSDSANAWNLIENKKYNHSQINDLLPVLSFIQPIDLTHFLWGENISFDHMDSLEFDNAKIILEKSNPDDSLLNKAIFSDGTNRNELLIIIKSRIPSIDFIDLRKYWNIILG